MKVKKMQVKESLWRETYSSLPEYAQISNKNIYDSQRLIKVK